MSRQRLPWYSTRELLVDGNNVLYALAGSADRSALQQLLARLRASLPTGMPATVVLDGPPDAGEPMRVEVGPGLAVRHAGRLSADGVIVAAMEAHPLDRRAGVVVVTNDLELRGRVARCGGRAEPVAWLADRLGTRPLMPSSTARAGPPIGTGAPHVPPKHAAPLRRASATRPARDAGPARHAGRGSDRTATPPPEAMPPDAAPPPPAGIEEEERASWQPGRGATHKRGNPKRRPKGRPNRRRRA